MNGAAQAPSNISGQLVHAQITPEQFDLSYRAIAAAAAEIPRETFDPDAIVRKVGNAPDDLADWVRENTSWVPYRGALRGPTGVLMDRVGNSLDRSLLLAELLRIAGHPVRLARGTISSQNAQRLTTQMSTVPRGATAQSANFLAAVEVREIEEYAKQLNVDADWMTRALADTRSAYAAASTEMGKRIAFQVPFLTEAVGAPDVPSDTSRKAIAAFSDHWWVQLDDGTGWVDLDATLSDEQRKVAQLVAAANYPFDKPAAQIPLASEFAHEIVFRVIVEQWSGGKVSEKVALEHAFRPSEIIGKQILFQNVPLHWTLDAGFVTESDPVTSFKDNLLEQTEWLPFLAIGDGGVYQASVLETGELNPDPDVRPVGPNTGGVADTLAGSESFGGEVEETPETHFTAEWIEYEIRVPGEPPDITRRVVFDILPDRSESPRAVDDPAPNSKRRLRRSLSLMGSTQILPMASRLSREYVLHQITIEALRSQRLLLGIQPKGDNSDLDAVVTQVRQCPPTMQRLYELGLARFEWSKVGADVYLGSPNILTYRRAVLLDAQDRFTDVAGYDIVSNSVAVSPRTRRTPFDIRVNQGVADTNAESVLMGRKSSGAGSLLGTAAKEASWFTIGKADHPSAIDMNVPPDVRAAIHDALQAGFVVVAPRSAGATERTGRWDWWRIDPMSGKTLGFTQEGWGGSATTEYKATVLEVIVAGGLAGAFSGAIAYVVCAGLSPLVNPTDDYLVWQSNLRKCKCVAVDVGTGVAVGVGGAIVAGSGWGLGLFLGVEGVGKIVCGAMGV
jgi:hypothetical protein